MLVKVDEDNQDKTLEGAVFELQGADGKVLQEGLTTNAEGKIVVENLKPGKYQFVETQAPKGYQLDETPISWYIKRRLRNECLTSKRLRIRLMLVTIAPQEKKISVR